MWEMRTIFFFIGKPEGKRPRGRTKRRWEDKILIGLREIG